MRFIFSVAHFLLFMLIANLLPWHKKFFKNEIWFEDFPSYLGVTVVKEPFDVAEQTKKERLLFYCRSLFISGSFRLLPVCFFCFYVGVSPSSPIFRRTSQNNGYEFSC